MSADVTAIVGGEPAARARCERVLEAMGIATAATPDAAAAGLLWFLDSAGIPDADTLPRLLAARTEEEAEIATGIAVDPAGAVIRWLAPTARSCDTQEMYAMLHRSRLPLVAAGADCLLVPRDLAVTAFGGAAERYGRLAGRVAVAELLAGHRGVIVPGARVTVDPAGAGPLRVRDLPDGLRAMRAGATVPRDLLNMVAPGLR